MLRRLRRDERGVAAMEMALITSVFAVAMMNVVEVGRYAYIVMEAQHATQVGAQAALVACDAAHVPATANCTTLTDAVTMAIQGTTLGTDVTLNGPIAEAYYCLDSKGALVFASSIGSKPKDCGAYGSSSLSPGLYLQVKTSYAYKPMFPGVTIGRTFPAAVEKTAWMRML